MQLIISFLKFHYINKSTYSVIFIDSVNFIRKVSSMNINPSTSCVGSINFINSISAIVLIPSFQSFPSIPSIPWSIVSLSPVPLIQSAPYSQYSLTSDSINSICTSKFTISFQFILPTKRFHCFYHEGRSHIWWTFKTGKQQIWWTSIIHIWLASRIQYMRTSYMMDIHLIHKWWTFIMFMNDGHPSYSFLLDIHLIH